MAKWKEFSDGFMLGRQMVKDYRAETERREMEEIAKSAPTEMQGYTAEDGDNLRKIAETRDADGNLAYRLDAKEGGSYGLSKRQEDGTYQPLDYSYDPKKVTDFMGQRFEGGMKPEKAAGMKRRAMADVVMRSDPVKGQAMLDAADDYEYKSDERKRTREEQGRADAIREGLGKVDTNVNESRSWADIFRDQAAVYKANGRHDEAEKYTLKADELAFKDAGKKFNTWSASAGKMELGQAAAELAKIFNTDGTPGSVKGIRPNSDGSITIGFQPQPGGTITPITVKSIDELKQAGFAHYNPENWAKIQEKRAEAALKAEEPYTLKPGERRVVNGKVVAEAPPPVGAIPIYDADGNIIRYDKSGSGSGGGAGKSGSGGKKDGVVDLTLDTIKESAAKGALEPGQVAGALRIGKQLVTQAEKNGTGLDPTVANEIAIGVATGKMPITKGFNPKTGTIDDVVEFQGNKFPLENFGTPTSNRLKREEVAGVATNYIASLPEGSRGKYVAAAFNPQARAKLDAELEQHVRAPEQLSALAQRLGREPTEADIKGAVNAAKAGMQPSLELISRYATLTGDGKKIVSGLLKEQGYTPDGKSEAPARPGAGQASGAAIEQPGGIRPQPTPQRRQEMIEAEKKRMNDAAADMARQAPIEAKRLLDAGNIPALARFQSSPMFSKLDKQTQLEVWKRVNGVQ